MIPSCGIVLQGSHIAQLILIAYWDQWHLHYLFWGDLYVPRDDPVLPLCLSNFSVPSTVTYLRRFQPSSEPMIKFPASRHWVFVEKGSYLVLDYFLIYSEMCFKKLSFALLFNCLLNVHLFFFAEDLVGNLDEVCTFWDISSFKDSDDEPLSISESSEDESSSLSLSDSSEDELYFLFLDPLYFF